MTGRTARTALEGLEQRFGPYLPDGPGTFVELGANDGINQSNTYWLEVERGWRGVLIEPSLNRYFELRHNRDDQNAFFCAACVPEGYEGRFVEMVYANLMTVPTGLSTDLPSVDEHVDAGARFLQPHEDVVVFGALARTLQSILDEAGAPPRVDFLSLDVEGAELDVLSGVDHSRQRFSVIVVECRDAVALARAIDPLGYRIDAQISHHDYVVLDTTGG